MLRSGSKILVGVTGGVGGVVAGRVWTLGMEVCRYGCGCAGYCVRVKSASAMASDVYVYHHSSKKILIYESAYGRLRVM